jgi:hypothetical protein
VRRALAAISGLISLSYACAIDTAPEGLRGTPPGSGPTVVFDMRHRPLPDIPQPNDIATFADPTSRTGRRLSVSLDAPTEMERRARRGFNELEGWGTFAPITVAFTRGLKADPHEPAIDLNDVAARMTGDDYDFANDPVYVVNLKTGVPAVLEMGNGNFSYVVKDPSRFWPVFPRDRGDILAFETWEEGAGLTQADYRPELDQDFDGVLDHPNTFGRGKIDGVDNLLTWYERETDTLILRPLLPLDEMTEYAVVLTDRLKGPDGQPVRSPFAYVHHPEQKNDLVKLRDILSDKSRANYFGDIAGTGFDHVAFAWTFTTQPIYDDMRLLRDGLYGKGPFGYLSQQFPTDFKAYRAVGKTPEGAQEMPGWQNDPQCQPQLKAPYIVRLSSAREMIHQLLEQVVGYHGPERDALEKAIVDNVDYFVIGSFEAPYYLGDPLHEEPGSRFHLNYRSGEGDIRRDTIPFWISVPKPHGQFKQPFNVVTWGHGTGLHGDEILIRSGYFAQHGLAMVGIDMPGHGLELDAGQQTLAEVFLRQACLLPWLKGVKAGRQEDLNGDGKPDSGGMLWTADPFHSRDNVRQSVLDQVAVVRLLRAFDGRVGKQDYNDDGKPDVLGDFDGDGVPDLGGPNVRYFTSGNSFGGIVAMVHGAVDPYVTASGPISGGGGLTDVAGTGNETPNSVLEQIYTPLVIGLDADERPPKNGTKRTTCADGEMTVRFVVNDLLDSAEVEIACLSKAELGPGKTVVVTNAVNKEVHCARTDPKGRFRIPIPSSVGERIDIQIYDAPDVVKSYKGCEVLPNAPVGRRISTWERPAPAFTTVGDDTKSCTSDTGCTQFRDTFFPVGSVLVAPNEGLGLLRQSPDQRRLFNLTQAAVDPSDPVNFARYYMLKPVVDIDGKPLPPRAILIGNTIGDPLVPPSTGNAFARAAGVLPFLPPSAATRIPEYADWATPQFLYDALGGKTPNQVLIEGHVLEGVSRFGRTPAGPKCDVNYITSALCIAPPPREAEICRDSLFDPDWLDEGTNHYDAQHPREPLRLARIASARAFDLQTLSDSWAPRFFGKPFTQDARAWKPGPALIGVVNAYLKPQGQHVWITSDPCKSWDDATYYDHMLGRFFASNGADIYFLSKPETHKCMATQSCNF